MKIFNPRRECSLKDKYCSKLKDSHLSDFGEIKLAPSNPNSQGLSATLCRQPLWVPRDTFLVKNLNYPRARTTNGLGIREDCFPIFSATYPLTASILPLT